MTRTRARPGIPFLVAVAAAAVLLASIAIHFQNELNGLRADKIARPPRPAFLVGTHDSEHEEERLRLFNEQLRGRCDLTSVSMRLPWIWFGRCRSGEEVVLVFQRDGKLEGAADLHALTSSLSPSDEQVRQRLFDAELRERCGVTSTHMESPGLWTADCRNGHRFRLRFEDGHLREWTASPR